MSDQEQTPEASPKFDFSAYPLDTCFYERRTRRDAKQTSAIPGPTLRRRKDDGSDPDRIEKRRRVDPTTFEKQYSDDELEFMIAMQRFKTESGKTFPSYGEVLEVARTLGYRRRERPDVSPAS